MSEKPAAEKPAKTGAGSGAESPTTARELDFDDDNDTPAAPENITSPPPPSKSPKPGVRFSENATEIPPARSPQIMDKRQQLMADLKEMFPGVDQSVIRAVYTASEGNKHRAAEALIAMNNPHIVEDTQDIPPTLPSRPQPSDGGPPKDDYTYAVELQRLENQKAAQRESEFQARRGGPQSRQRQQTGLKPNELHDDKEHSFFDDDLPVIRKNIEQGFRDTQKSVNKWIGDLIKKIDGEDEQYDKYGNPVAPGPRRQNYGPSQSDQMHGIRKSAEQRRSADRERYDTDNRVLGDDFEALELRDDETPPPKPPRPSANPDLFKPTPVSPPQSGPVDEVDALYRNPSPNNQNSQGKSGGKKWQPLTSVAPHPEPEDHDPFSLGDSDEEEAKTKDIKAEDTERLKKAADAKESTAGPELKESERSGSVGQKDAAAEALLKESK